MKTVYTEQQQYAHTSWLKMDAFVARVIVHGRRPTFLGRVADASQHIARRPSPIALVVDLTSRSPMFRKRQFCLDPMPVLAWEKLSFPHLQLSSNSPARPHRFATLPRATAVRISGGCS